MAAAYRGAGFTERTMRNCHVFVATEVPFVIRQRRKRVKSVLPVRCHGPYMFQPGLLDGAAVTETKGVVPPVNRVSSLSGECSTYIAGLFAKLDGTCWKKMAAAKSWYGARSGQRLSSCVT